MGCLGFTCDDGVKTYHRMGAQAFSPQFTTAALNRIVKNSQITTHKYQHRALEFVLQQELGSETEFVCDRPKVAVLAVQWNMRPKMPVLFRSYPTPETDKNEAPAMTGVEGVKMWQAARATSAAPTYFRPSEVSLYFNVRLLYFTPYHHCSR
eukprot:m.172161 g.172161  ORF g.172161 m.172161 type:complete len:152 (-) comp15361_c0_seq4:585-1040(-)